MKNHDKPGGKIQGFILLGKHAGNNTVDRMKKAVKKRTIIEEEIPELLINGKNTMPMRDMEQFEGHGGRALHGIEIAAGRAEATVATKRDKL